MTRRGHHITETFYIKWRFSIYLVLYSTDALGRIFQWHDQYKYERKAASARANPGQSTGCCQTFPRAAGEESSMS